jgi:hypothetical protein
MKVTSDSIQWDISQMLEVYLNEPDDFSKIRETLTRIGIESKRNEKTLYQSCHILHKQGRYYIVHFKEMFMLDGKPSTFTVDDRNRRNTIAILLSDWGLLRIANMPNSDETTGLKNIKIIPYASKVKWNLLSKYSIGNVKKKEE